MKKTINIFLAFFFLMNLSHPALAKGFKVGCYLNYYAITDSTYKDVYGGGNLMLGASLDAELIRKLELKVEGNYFQDKGKMNITQEEITFTLKSLVIGLRFRLIETRNLRPNISPYLGTGIDYHSYTEDTPERFKDVSESTIGYHVETGTYMNLGHGFLLDLNVRYIKADVKPFDEKIGLGGWRAGIGIEYYF